LDTDQIKATLMARTLRDSTLDTRAARSRLRARGKPYYRAIEEGLHLGYRRVKGRPGKPAAAGKWVLRHYIGNQSYSVEAIGTADDLSDADGVAIMSFAQAQALAREHMVRRAHHAAGKRGPLTVRDAIEDYLAYLDSNRRGGRDARYRAEAQILPQLGDIEVESLTPEHLRRWQAALVKGAPRRRTKPGDKQRFGRTPDTDEARRRRCATVNRVFAVLRAALNRAWREGKIRSDDAWRRVEPFEGVAAARVRYLSVTEARRLVNACGADFRQLVLAGLMTGARVSELIALRVADFDSDAAAVTVRMAKSGRGRHIILTEEGVALFRAFAAGKPGDAMLLTRADGAPWGGQHQVVRMRAACTRARIEPAVGFHTLRHSYASLSIMNGVPLLVIARNLGHSDARMIEKHYGHLAPSYIADAIRAGAPRFGFTPDQTIVPLSATKGPP
jgi:integrase